MCFPLRVLHAFIRSFFALLGVIAALSLVPGEVRGEGADVRPLTAAERAAVEAVAGFLNGGAEAIWVRLDEEAPFRSIGHQQALEEIEARLGPPTRSRWRLSTSDPKQKETATFLVQFPSTVDDTIEFRMRERNGSWRVHSIRTLVEPRGPESVGESRPVGGEVHRRLSRDEVALSRRVAVVLVLVAMVAAIVAAALRSSREGLAIALLATSGLFFLAHAIAFLNPRVLHDLASRSDGASRLRGGFTELRALVPLRRAVSRGLPSTVRTDNLPPDAARAAKLWQAQLALAQERTRDAEGLLSEPYSGDVPMISLLRARNAAAAGDYPLATEQYEALLASGPLCDTILLEAFVANAMMSEEKGRSVLARAKEIGSREPSLHYIDAVVALAGGKTHDSIIAFRNAWLMQPLTRSELLSDAISSVYTADPITQMLVDLSSPEEPSAAVEPSGARLKLPPSATAATLGRTMRIAVRDGLLDVPGGAVHAPEGSERLTATEWKRREAAAAKERLSGIRDMNVHASLLFRDDLATAIEAFASEANWNAVLDLTAAVVRSDRVGDPEIAGYRVHALVKNGQGEAARRLALAAARSPMIARRNDWLTLMALSDEMATLRDYRSALEILSTAARLNNVPDFTHKIRQLELRRDLTMSSDLMTTHFMFRVTPDVPAAVVERVGQILEAELVRLQTVIPYQHTTPIAVNLTTWKQFSEQITGSEHIVGIYDGEITYPFAAVNKFVPETVAILTHELVHAMLARATRDRAPAWLHEGLASRLELLPLHDNVFQHRAPESLRALELIDATIDGAADLRATGEAYSTAQTLIRYLEARHGQGTMRLLIENLAKGKSTDAALRAVTGRNLTEIDRDFREWGKANSASFVDHTPWPYGAMYSLGVDPRVRQGISFSRSKENH
jgi:hypothetical protein